MHVSAALFGPFWCGTHTHTHTFLSFFLVPFSISLRSSPVQAAAAACPNGKVKRCRLRLIQFAQLMTFCLYDKNERAESGYCRTSYCATLTLTAFPSPCLSFRFVMWCVCPNEFCSCSNEQHHHHIFFTGSLSTTTAQLKTAAAALKSAWSSLGNYYIT